MAPFSPSFKPQNPSRLSLYHQKSLHGGAAMPDSDWCSDEVLNLPKWPTSHLEGGSVPDFIKIRPKPFQMKPTRA
ncbi:hypothetical protein COLO4_08109 [Corchorus olitorius]|uniref:Uncharacterized protein n=1 Tax=Corchorus olitorius TaxID=93759 RepID=A0A1R3KHB0_9ROSI|nr:hypothetical protein COLO4_08109 [Corchorus olitorius]